MSRRFILPGRSRPGQRQRAQGLVEFGLFVPLLLVFVLTIMDFGFALFSNLTLEYSSREGARVGAALAAGNSTTLPCAQVDNHVIAAVQRVLQSSAMSVPLDNGGDATKTGVNWIRIFKATSDVNGGGYDVVGNYNQWTYAASGGATVDGATLKFIGPVTPSWSACSRSNGITPDKIGIAINYTYSWKTPLANLVRLASGGSSFMTQITFLDRTVMNLNPTYP